MKATLGRFVNRFVAATVLAVLTTAPLAAQHTMTAGTASGVPGESVVVAVTLDNAETIRGFSFGLTHDSLLLTPSLIEQGLDLSDTNATNGADFFFTDTNPVGGPGVVVGCVISTIPPIEELAIATDNEIALITYDINPLAAAGASSTIDFSDALGSPPVLTVVSVGGFSAAPTVVSGSVSTLLTPVADLSCVLADKCLCEFSITWTNPVAYDAIQIFEDGLLIDTLLGTETSYTRVTAMGEVRNLSVVPTFTAADLTVLEAAEATCVLDCPVIPVPLTPLDLVCTPDRVDCSADIVWTNAELYTTISVRLDGVEVASLAGDAITTNVLLGDNLIHTVSVVGIDQCGAESLPAECEVACPELLVRGDGNADGVIDVSDPIFGLDVLFLAGVPFCEDAMDANDDGQVDTADVIFTLDYIFQGGLAPALPFPDCGADLTDDLLGCESYSPCD